MYTEIDTDVHVHTYTCLQGPLKRTRIGDTTTGMSTPILRPSKELEALWKKRLLPGLGQGIYKIRQEEHFMAPEN